MRRLDRASGCSDVWPDSQGVSVRAFVDGNYIWKQTVVPNVSEPHPNSWRRGRSKELSQSEQSLPGGWGWRRWSPALRRHQGFWGRSRLVFTLEPQPRLLFSGLGMWHGNPHHPSCVASVLTGGPWDLSASMIEWAYSLFYINILVLFLWKFLTTTT